MTEQIINIDDDDDDADGVCDDDTKVVCIKNLLSFYYFLTIVYTEEIVFISFLSKKVRFWRTIAVTLRTGVFALARRDLSESLPKCTG